MLADKLEATPGPSEPAPGQKRARFSWKAHRSPQCMLESLLSRSFFVWLCQTQTSTLVPSFEFGCVNYRLRVSHPAGGTGIPGCSHCKENMVASTKLCYSLPGGEQPAGFGKYPQSLSPFKTAQTSASSSGTNLFPCNLSKSVPHML